MTISKVIKTYLNKHVMFLIVAFLIIACDIAVTFLPPIMLKYIVDTVVANGDKHALLVWGVYYALAFLGLGLFEFLKSVVLIKISQGICKELRVSLLARVHDMNYEALSAYDVGTLESYFNNDVNSINNLVSEGVISMLIDIFKMIGAIVSIFFFSVNIGYVVLAISPFLAAFIYYVRKRMYKAQLKSKALEADVNQQVLENIDNVESIQTYDAFNYINSKYEETLSDHFDAQTVSMFYDSIFSPIMMIIRYSLIAIIIIISVENPAAFGISIGTFLSLSDLLSDLFSPLENIGMEIQTLQSSTASIHRVNDFMKERPGEKKTFDSKDISVDNCGLTFTNVSYSYDKKRQVLSDFNLDIKDGERLTLKGESGVGKSTIFKLAYGLLSPDKGRVVLNGQDTSLLNETNRKKLFGIVYQDAFFSGGTIKEEVTLGDTSYSDSQVSTVLRLVGLNRIQDINIPLKEIDYSSGELALFNIARVILRNPPVIFLDEMNAKIDPETASAIIDILNKYAKGHMILSISHYGTQLENSTQLTIKAQQTL
jgi:ATP-binding cassette subfamily B multidrug efflux pump